jgi:hypothetical protein
MEKIKMENKSRGRIYRIDERFSVRIEKTEYDFEEAYSFSLCDKQGHEDCHLDTIPTGEIQFWNPDKDLRTAIVDEAKAIAESHIERIYEAIRITQANLVDIEKVENNITTYKLPDNFFVEVEEFTMDGCDQIRLWVYHKEYGIKAFRYGIPRSSVVHENFEADVANWVKMEGKGCMDFYREHFMDD